ncbi:AAA family ATPase [Salipiger sp. PrR002]|uniref:AAA family ATPase n=1 Tax=Salipiger sp. PrR002 TaxID=2706489 RepID=UPI0013DC6567|nr:AAA family ATPase [Salipiger sp. PrR002]
MELWLECLGGLALSRDGTPIALSARKARMLLGLLAAARRRSMSRARLAALLWETSDAEQARVSLRQASAQIRRACGEGWIEAEGDDLRLGTAVSTDLDAFHAALARNDAAEAVRLYRGPFLDGHDGVSPDLEQALSAERARLSSLACETLARELERVEDSAGASTLAHRLLGLDPLNELAHRRLMRIDAANGMRGAARARFEALETALARDLGTAPEPETRALFDRIRRGSGGASAPAAAIESDAAPEVAPAYLLLGLEMEPMPDHTVLHRAALAAGAEEHSSGPGEIAFLFSGQELRPVSNVALELAAAADGSMAFGLVDVTGADAVPTRCIVDARRIAALAEPGQVLLARDLATRLGLAAAPDQRAVHLQAGAAPQRPQLPMIGRALELAQAEAAIGAAADMRTSLVVHISGEAGIGKSRLATEILHRAGRSGRATVEIGFDAFSPGERHPAQRLASSLPKTPGPRPDATAVERAVLAWLTDPEIAPDAALRMSALDPETQQRLILDVLSEAFRQAASDAALIVLIEDCHWSPLGAGDFILELLGRLQESPVIFLLTERPHEGSLDHRLSARAQAGVVRIALSPLPQTAARELVQAIAPGHSIPNDTVAHAGGHPLFLIRLLEAKWSAGALPQSVAELVQEQIERLPEDERAALRRASILGVRFSSSDCAAIFPELPRPRPNGDLLHPADLGLAFGHDLVHRAIYESVPEPLRKEWHARAASHFRETDPIRWADHALKTDSDAEACRAAAAAANAMIAARRFSAALPYVEAGLARGGEPEAVAELHSCRAGLRRIRGDMAGALDDYRAAHASATRAETRAAMLCRQALVLHRMDRGTEADRALDAAEEIADSIGLSGLGRAEIHEQRGNRAFVLGDLAVCMAQHRASLAAAEATGDPRGIARGHGGIGDAAYAAGRFATAFHHFSRAVEKAEEAGLGLVREEYLFMRAFSLFFAEPGPRAHLLVDIAVDSAMQCGAARTEMIGREVRAEMRLANADLRGLEEDLEAITKLASARGESRFSKDVETLYAFVALRRGDMGAARARLEPLLLGAGTDAYVGGTIFGLAVLAAKDSPQRDQAIADGLACIARGSLAHAVIWFHACVLERAMLDGDTDLAKRHVDLLETFTRDEPIGLVSHMIRAAELGLRSAAEAERRALESALRDACLADFVRAFMPRQG